MKTEDCDLAEFIFTREQLQNAHFIIDYDGTLIPLVTTLEEGVLPESTKKILCALKEQYQIEVSILSGRPLDFLKVQFADSPAFLAGSHGAEFFNYQTGKTQSLVSEDRSHAIAGHHQFFTNLIRRYPNSFIETKPLGVAIHYGKCQSLSVPEIERILFDYVQDQTDFFSKQGLIYFQGKNVLEIKYKECNKGNYLNTFRAQTGLQIENIFAFGDDENDENIFREINKSAKGHTFRVGQSKTTAAKHRLQHQSQVLETLAGFLRIG